MAGGGFLVDWELKTSLDGLYAAGGAPLFGGGCHGESHTTGRYAGRMAAAYAKTVAQADDRPAPGGKGQEPGLRAAETNQERHRLEGNQCGHRPDHAGLLRPV